MKIPILYFTPLAVLLAVPAMSPCCFAQTNGRNVTSVTMRVGTEDVIYRQVAEKLWERRTQVEKTEYVESARDE